MPELLDELVNALPDSTTEEKKKKPVDPNDKLLDELVKELPPEEEKPPGALEAIGQEIAGAAKAAPPRAGIGAGLLQALDVISTLPSEIIGSIRQDIPLGQAIAEKKGITSPADFSDDPGLEEFRKTPQQSLITPEERQKIAQGTLTGAEKRSIKKKTTEAFQGETEPRSAEEKSRIANEVGVLLADPFNLVGIGLGKKGAELLKFLKGKNVGKVAETLKEVVGVSDDAARIAAKGLVENTEAVPVVEKVISKEGVDVTERAQAIERQIAEREKLLEPPIGKKKSKEPLKQEEKVVPKTAGINLAPKVTEKVTVARDRAIEAFQDSKIRVKRMQELEGVKLKGKGLDPYEAEIRYHGKVDHAVREVIDETTNIIEDMTKTSKTLKGKVSDEEINNQVSKFLIARHAPERNAALGKAKAAGITDKEAENILEEIDKLPHANEVKRIAERIQSLNNKTLDILHDGEIIDDKLYNLLRKRYKNHIPLQRILEDTDNSEIVDILTGGKGFSVKGTGLKRAKGSELEVDDILTNVTANVTQAIVRAEKNAVAKATLDFARNNTHLGLFEEVKPEVIGLSLKKDPLTKKPYPLMNTKELMNDKNILVIREKGNPVYLKINDPLLASALKATNEKTLGTLVGGINVITKFVTQTATRFNPAFQVPNLIRDAEEMAVYLHAQKGFGTKGAVGALKEVRSSMRDVYHGIRNIDSPGGRLYRQFKADGGSTGGLALSTRENLTLDIEKIRKTSRSRPRKAIKSLVNFFDNYNALFEESTRLAVYKEALNRKFTREEAAIFAKEATINFNRRGTAGQHMNALYAFANASVQGSAKMIRALKNPKTLATVATTMLTAEMGSQLWNDSVDPKWRDKTPAWIRDNNLVLVVPSKTDDFKTITIPVSWGLKPIKAMTGRFIDSTLGHDIGSKAKVATEIAVATIDAFNPTGGGTFLQAVSPTFMDVPVAIAENKTFFGTPMKPESPYFPNLPEHQKYFRSLGKSALGAISISAAKYLAEGNSVSISPQVLKYSLEQAGGGTLKFATRTFNFASSIGKGELGKVNEIPVVRRFFRKTPADVVENYMLHKKLNDPSLKTLQAKSDEIKFMRTIQVRDAFEQYQRTKIPAEREQIKKDLLNSDPKAYKAFLRRLKDSEKGIDYYDSVLKDIEPKLRAERVIIELDRASDKQNRLKELRRAGVVNKETLSELRKNEKFLKLKLSIKEENKSGLKPLKKTKPLKKLKKTIR